MKKTKGISKGLGLNSDNEISKELNRAVSYKQREAIQLNDAWREAIKNNPDILKTTTFLEFRREWYKKQKSRPKQKRPKLTPEEIRYQGKIQSEYNRKCNEIPTFKEAVPFRDYLKKRAPEMYEDEQRDIEKRQRSFEVAQRLNNIKSPTFWEKMDKDPAYASAVKSREDGSMSNQWGIGKAKYRN
jgi:hypothetical protein